MRTISYYFAMSLDGFIARPDHKVDWLDPYFTSLETPYDFEPYMATVSAVVMGRKTYEVSRELGPLPLGGNRGFVYTRDPEYRAPEPEVEVISSDVAAHIQALRASGEGRIWVLGGGVLAGFLLERELLDELAITLMPVLIGEGIPWIGGLAGDHGLQLREQYTGPKGIVQLIYGK